MKKIIKTLVAVTICIALSICITAMAAMIVHEDNTTGRSDSGYCNPYNMISWTLTEETLVNVGNNCYLIIKPADNADFYDEDHPEYRVIDDYEISHGMTDSPWTLFAENPSKSRYINSITVESGIEQIGANAFYGQSKLYTVNLYPTLDTIREGAFSDCTAITRIVFHGTREQWESITIESDNGIFNNSYEQLKSSGILHDGCEINGHTLPEGDYSSDADGHWKICQVCNMPVVQAHTLTIIQTNSEPDCTNAGEDFCRCTVCGYEKNVATAPLGHTAESEEWLSNAVNHYHICATCGQNADVAAHTFGEWSVYTAPTLSKNGLAMRACTVCAYVEFADISYIPGDINCDGTVDETDADLIAQYVSGLISGDNLKTEAGDVNGDGVFNVLDCVKIMLYLDGQIPSLGELVTPAPVNPDAPETPIIPI